MSDYFQGKYCIVDLREVVGLFEGYFTEHDYAILFKNGVREKIWTAEEWRNLHEAYRQWSEGKQQKVCTHDWDTDCGEDHMWSQTAYGELCVKCGRRTG